ncbi:DUF4432 family protein [Paenibacillus sp. GCM10027626]|uniref:DUF4432 family protein n=1 Tax=Paenibacillus sp. GCM10027626 TaxID=3273411 RepID=UPI0036389340
MEYQREGNRFLTIENERLRMTFWLNKGADMIELCHKPSDVDVLWHAPLPIHKPGDYTAPASSGSGTFFDYYPGGWQEVFPNSHLPTSEYKDAPLGLHGEVCLLPWSYRVEEDQGEHLKIQLAVQTVRTPFRLAKTIEIFRDQPWFYLHETIVNIGQEEMAYNWGHHPTFGAPLLDEGSIIDVPEGSVTVTPDYPYSATARYAQGQRKHWPMLRDVNGDEVNAARVKSAETRTSDSFHLELSEGWASLRNPKLDIGIGLAWDIKQFPYLWCWQGYGGSWGYPFYGRNYNIALEPFTNPIGNLVESIASGHSRNLQPSGSATTTLRVGFTRGDRPIRRIRVEEGETYDF